VTSQTDTESENVTFLSQWVAHIFSSVLHPQ